MRRRVLMSWMAAALLFGGLAPAAHADHCPEGYEHDTDPETGEPLCRGSVAGLFPEDDDSGSEPGSTGSTTTVPPGDPDFDPGAGLRSTSTSTLPPPDPDPGAADTVDVGAAILDALDDRFSTELLRSPEFADRLGCETVSFQCDTVAAALALARDFINGVMRVRSTSEQRVQVGEELGGAALLGALRDDQGELLFPTVMAAMPIVTALAQRALDGGEEELETLRSFSRLLVSLDARSQGILP